MNEAFVMDSVSHTIETHCYRTASGRLCENSENPTHGSGWIVQVRPTTSVTEFLNPTNGSWWIVQIRPPNKAAKRMQSEFSFIPSTSTNRLDLNNPPTSVAGICKLRKPTYVGWI